MKSKLYKLVYILCGTLLTFGCRDEEAVKPGSDTFFRYLGDLQQNKVKKMTESPEGDYLIWTEILNKETAYFDPVTEQYVFSKEGYSDCLIQTDEEGNLISSKKLTNTHPPSSEILANENRIIDMLHASDNETYLLGIFDGSICLDKFTTMLHLGDEINHNFLCHINDLTDDGRILTKFLRFAGDVIAYANVDSMPDHTTKGWTYTVDMRTIDFEGNGSASNHTFSRDSNDIVYLDKYVFNEEGETIIPTGDNVYIKDGYPVVSQYIFKILRNGGTENVMLKDPGNEEILAFYSLIMTTSGFCLLERGNYVFTSHPDYDEWINNFYRLKILDHELKLLNNSTTFSWHESKENPSLYIAPGGDILLLLTSYDQLKSAIVTFIVFFYDGEKKFEVILPSAYRYKVPKYAFKTSQGDYVILADFELEGESRATMIKLDPYGNIFY